MCYFFFGGGGGACGVTMTVGPLETLRISNVSRKFGKDGKNLDRFSGAGNAGFVAIALKFGFAIDPKKDGAPPDDVVLFCEKIEPETCACAGSASASQTTIPRNPARRRIAHLPQFEILPI